MRATSIFLHCSEIYEAQRWLADDRFSCPMVTHKDQDIFLGDVVTYNGVECGLVQKFLNTVSDPHSHKRTSLSSCYDKYNMQASSGVQVTVRELVGVPGAEDLAIAEAHTIPLCSVDSVADADVKTRVHYQIDLGTTDEEQPHVSELTPEVI